MKSLLLITPENPGLKLYRQKQRNNFCQLTMPYLAGFVPDGFTLELVDEQYQDIPRKHFDLVGITVNTPNAPHAYIMAAKFKKEGSLVVMGGPHVTAYDSKTKVAIQPANMSKEELLEGFQWFSGEFYSLRNILRRFRENPVNRLYNLYINLGYRKAHRHYMKNR